MSKKWGEEGSPEEKAPHVKSGLRGLKKIPSTRKERIPDSRTRPGRVTDDFSTPFAPESEEIVKERWGQSKGFRSQLESPQNNSEQQDE